MNALSASGTGMLGPVARNAVISLTSSLASPETVSNSSEPLISDMSAVIGFSAKKVGTHGAAAAGSAFLDQPAAEAGRLAAVATCRKRDGEANGQARVGSDDATENGMAPDDRHSSSMREHAERLTAWLASIEPADRPVTHVTLDLCRTGDRLILCRKATAADSKRCRRKRHRNETFCSPGPDVRDALPNNRIRSHVEEGVRLGPKRMPTGVVLDDHLPHTVSRNPGGHLGRHRVIPVLPVPGLFRALTEAGVD